MDSRLVQANGRPAIEANGEVIPVSAYVTYFTENAAYGDFTAAGFRLFSVCAYFTDLPINEDSGFTAARTGIFEKKGEPDYSEFDADMEQLLRVNPDALVFPRIYISMPLWWVRENPGECVKCGVTPEGREMLFSDRFRTDGGAMLRSFIRHVRAMPYAERIVGYQISGGTTQEWFHFGRDGSFCENALPYFARYLSAKRPGAAVDPEQFLRRAYHEDYVDFSNESAAGTVAYFARVAKEECRREQIVGTFYGYSLEVALPLSGTHALNRLLDCPDIDFFCSPVSYANQRKLGLDAVSMLPEDSLRLHGKLYVVEADIRTFLSRYPDECRKDIRLAVPYRHPIWLGDPTERLSVLQLRKHFAKFLTHSRSFWWFDMWGGWYASEELMAEIGRQQAIAALPTREILSTKQRAAVLIDEKMYKRFPDDLRQHRFCEALSSSGVPYDLFLLSDAGRLLDRYDLFFLPFPEENEFTALPERAGKVCVRSAASDPAEIRAAAEKAGVPVWVDTPDVFYCGNGFMALHARDGGEKTITMPAAFSCAALTGHAFRQEGSVLRFDLEQYDTAIFRIEKAAQE